MKIELFKLRSFVIDTGTGMEGMLTHSAHFQDGSIRYGFQPRGLDQETKEPLKRIFLESARVVGSNPPIEEIELPVEILGTIVTDEASGFTGRAIQLIQHTHGCVHVMVQSQEKTKSGNPVDPCDFNFIQLIGEAIKPMTEGEKEVSRKKKPSPSGMPSGLI